MFKKFILFVKKHYEAAVLTCSSLAFFLFGLMRGGDSDDEATPLVSVRPGETADDSFDFLNFSASRLLPASRDRPASRLFPAIRLSPTLVMEVPVFSPTLVMVVPVFLLLVLLLKLVVVVVAMVVVALVTVFGDDFGESLEGEEECDLLVELSFPDNSTMYTQ
jgi:hypothetical protein